MINKKVAIALASFNGAKYIEEQIVSIQANTYEDWQLIISDDGSTDNTLDIIKKLQINDPRIVLLESETPLPLGFCQNFNKILTYIFKHQYDVFFLSDQDDLWRPEKLATQLEMLSDQKIPQLIYTDLEIVDKNIIKKETSYFQFHNINPEQGQILQYLLIENCITGCTISGNRKLLESALPFPKTVYNHDWWLALIASCTGSISYINQPLTKYRQHSSNQIGGNSIIEILLSRNKNINMIFKKHSRKLIS